MTSRKDNKYRVQYILSGIGIFLIAFGIPFAIFWPQIFESILIKEMYIGPTSKSFSEWKKPSLPIYMDIYFFNWTNPQDFTNHSTKPILVELGPYRFREQREKVNLTWHDSNSTVSYRQISVFHFDAEGSKGSLEDEISTVNLVSAGSNAKALNAAFLTKKQINVGLTIYEQEISITKTAAELIFEGYEDNMVTMGMTFKSFGDFGDVPMEYDKVGWFYKRNNTPEMSLTYNVHTGLDDLSQFGKIQMVEHSNKNHKYSGKCGDYFGSPGEFYGFGKTKEETIALLTADMCRSLEFDYEEDIEVHGLKAYKYGGDRFIDNGTKYPEQACFCEGDCMPSGVMNITKCRYDSPVFMSLPHYLYGDPFYQNQVEGLNPTKEKHEFFIGLEPVTGIPIKVASRLQANVLIRKDEGVNLFADVKDTFIPVMWVEHVVTVDEETIANLKVAAMMPTAGRIVGFSIAIIGIFLVICIPAVKFLKGMCSPIKVDTQEPSTSSDKKQASPLLQKQKKIEMIPMPSTKEKEKESLN